MITNSMASKESFGKHSVVQCLVAIVVWMVASQAAPGQNARPTQAEQAFQEAVTLSVIGDPKLARRPFLEAIQQWLQARQPERAARAAIQLGDSYIKGKKYEEALFCYKQAADLKAIGGSTRAAALNCIAKLYADIYLYEPASRHFEQAIAQARRAGDWSTQAAALAGLADVFRQTGESGKAMDCIARARRLIRGQGDGQTEAALLHLAGQIDQERGRLGLARRGFERALSIYKQSGDDRGQIEMLCALSGLDLASSRAQSALVRAEQAVELAAGERNRAATNADKLIARESQWRSLLSLARAQRALGQVDSAVKSYVGAIFQLEALFLSAYVSNEATAISFREQRQAPYRELAALLIDLGRVDEAYDQAERAKARAILSMVELRRLKGPLANFGDERLGELTRSVSTLRTQLLSQRIGRVERARLERNLREAEYALQERRLSLEMQRFRDRISWFPMAGIGQLQQRARRDNCAILEFLLGEDRSFAWLIASNKVSLEVLPGRKRIEEAVSRYLDLINSQPSNLYLDRDLSEAKAQAEKLFSSLLGGLAEQLEGQRKLIVVPDGLLHYLPFEALMHNAKYLVEEHEISYVPSASMLSLWELPSESEFTDKMQLLAFGDPVFGPDSGPAVYQFKNARRVARQMERTRMFRLPPLPRTHDEVEHIAGFFQPGTTRVYLGEQSTEDALKREPLRRYRRLHFATHSLIDEATPSRSAVVLALDDDPAEDGFLEVSEISELDLDCDLVVLSACQTGRGQLRSGEGIVGLTRAFLYAGARLVVVSLWSVSDLSTGQLMKNFYQHLAAHSGNAAALRLAKLEMLRGVADKRHPYYWAPFVAVGKPWG
jgi:CHAT domain-containing protein